MAKRNSKAWRRPLTVHSLAEYGGLDFDPPQSEFRAAGPWELSWQIWLLTPSKKESHHHGFVRIQKGALRSDSTFLLSVEQHIIEQHGITRQKAQIRCRSDAVATPLWWEKRFDARFPKMNRTYASVGFEKKGSLSGSRIFDGALQKTVALPLSSNWSLLEALQRLAAGVTSEMPPFTLLDELEKIKEEQRITFAGRRQIAFGTKEISVNCYRHVGRAMLPWRYYFDLQGRLLIALSGLQALILNPQVEEIQRKRLKRLGWEGFE